MEESIFTKLDEDEDVSAAFDCCCDGWSRLLVNFFFVRGVESVKELVGISILCEK